MKKATILALLILSLLSAATVGTNMPSQDGASQNTETSVNPQPRCNLPNAA